MTNPANAGGESREPAPRQYEEDTLPLEPHHQVVGYDATGADATGADATGGDSAGGAPGRLPAELDETARLRASHRVPTDDDILREGERRLREARAAEGATPSADSAPDATTPGASTPERR